MRSPIRLALALVLAVALPGCSSASVASHSSPLAPSSPVATAPVPASPDPCRHSRSVVTTSLAVQNFGRIVVDPSSCHVLVSSPASNTIVVLDYSGHVIKAISDEFGADAMVIEGSTLFLALTATGSIDPQQHTVVVDTLPLG